jgi:ABC-type proline/glycine betaine transport system substrate-binding protein
MAKLTDAQQIHVMKVVAKAIKEERRRVARVVKEMTLPPDMTARAAAAVRKTVKQALAAD